MRLIRFICLLPALWMAGMVAAEAAETGRVDFNRHIRPLLSDRCFACHGPDEAGRKARLRLDVPDGLHKKDADGSAILSPGDPSKSEAFLRIISTDPDEVMPATVQKFKARGFLPVNSYWAPLSFLQD